MRASATVALVLVLACAGASRAHAETPAAATRNNESNFRDMVLAVCISRIQQGRSDLSADAASTARALVDWTYYDAETSPDMIDRLVNEFLRRDYRNPIGDAAVERTGFGLLKCLDLYHSKELAALIGRVVLYPKSARRR